MEKRLQFPTDARPWLFLGLTLGLTWVFGSLAEVHGQLLSIPAVLLVILVWGAGTLTRGEKTI